MASWLWWRRPTGWARPRWRAGRTPSGSWWRGPGWLRPGRLAGRRSAGGRALGSPRPGFDADAARAEIRRGGDPLGEAFCALRGPARRRPLGQTFTPPTIIESMIAWAAGAGSGRPGSSTRAPDRPGSSSRPGAGGPRPSWSGWRSTRWPRIIGRASLAAAGLAARSRIILGDYRAVTLPHRAGADAVPGQSAVRPPSPDRAGLEGLAAPRRGRVRACPPAGWPGCTCTSSWPPRGTPGPGIWAR